MQRAKALKKLGQTFQVSESQYMNLILEGRQAWWGLLGISILLTSPLDPLIMWIDCRLRAGERGLRYGKVILLLKPKTTSSAKYLCHTWRRFVHQGMICLSRDNFVYPEEGRMKTSGDTLHLALVSNLNATRLQPWLMLYLVSSWADAVCNFRYFVHYGI